jgi:hypothetical protein
MRKIAIKLAENSKEERLSSLPVTFSYNSDNLRHLSLNSIINISFL